MSEISKVKRRRNRVSLVCSNCKEKKIKCNRQQPCSNCIKSSLISSCTYNYSFKKEKDSSLTTEEKNEEKSKETEVVSADDVHWEEGSPGTTYQKTILDVEFSYPNEYNVFRKPSNTQLRPIFHCAYMREEHVLSFKFLMSFKQLLNNERRLWKSKNFNKNFQLIELQYGGIDIKDGSACQILNQWVNDMICNNYYAILERLRYFQTELNKILFNSYIPMGVVQLIFHYYFNMKQEGVVFRRPRKNFEYSFIALITSLVELTNIFTRYADYSFNFPLPQQNNEFNELSVKLLNASNYRRKRTIFAVYTLLNLRLSLMVYGDAQSGGVAMQNTQPLFQTAVSIFIEMGLHANLDKILYFEPPPNVSNGHEHFNELFFAKDIPTESLKVLWNYLLVTDITYYIDLSTHPFINDRFCHGFYKLANRESTSTESIWNLIREISYELLSQKPYTLRMIAKYDSKLIKLLSSLGSFADYQSFEKNEEKWQSFHLMFKILKLIYMFQFKIHAFLDEGNLYENYSKDVVDDKKNQEIIKSLKKECGIKSKIVYFLGISALLKMSESNLSYKFLLYNREVFSTWIGTESILLIDMILTDGLRAKNKKIVPAMDEPKNFSLPEVRVFDIKELEDALYNFSAKKHSQLLLQIEDTCEPENILSFMSYCYEKIINVPALFSDYKFFVMTKLFFLTIYFLYSYIETHCDSFKTVYNNLEKLRAMTQKIISKNLQEGRLLHLLPTHQVIDELRERDDGSKNAQPKSDSLSNLSLSTNTISKLGEQMHSSADINWTPDSLSTTSSMLPSQFDDIASAVFEDEGMVNILNEINQYFNQPMG